MFTSPCLYLNSCRVKLRKPTLRLKCAHYHTRHWSSTIYRKAYNSKHGLLISCADSMYSTYTYLRLQECFIFVFSSWLSDFFLFLQKKSLLTKLHGTGWRDTKTYIYTESTLILSQKTTSQIALNGSISVCTVWTDASKQRWREECEVHKAAVCRQHLDRNRAAGPASSAAGEVSPGPDQCVTSQECLPEFYWPEVNSFFHVAPDKITCLLCES